MWPQPSPFLSRAIALCAALLTDEQKVERGTIMKFCRMGGEDEYMLVAAGPDRWRSRRAVNVRDGTPMHSLQY